MILFDLEYSKFNCCEAHFLLMFFMKKMHYANYKLTKNESQKAAKSNEGITSRK